MLVDGLSFCAPRSGRLGSDTATRWPRSPWQARVRRGRRERRRCVTLLTAAVFGEGDALGTTASADAARADAARSRAEHRPCLRSAATLGLRGGPPEPAPAPAPREKTTTPPPPNPARQHETARESYSDPLASVLESTLNEQIIFVIQPIIAAGLSLALGALACGEDDSPHDQSERAAGRPPGRAAGRPRQWDKAGHQRLHHGAGRRSTSASASASSGGVTTASGGDPNPDPANARTFDHRHASSDAVSRRAAPRSSRRGDFVFHYAHRSHGFQIIVGAESIEAKTPTYAFETEYCDVPQQEGACLMWGRWSDRHRPHPGRGVLGDRGRHQRRAHHPRRAPGIRYSMWAWSSEISRADRGGRSGTPRRARRARAGVLRR